MEPLYFPYHGTSPCRVILLKNVSLGLKKNPVFRATRPYLWEPADPRLFTKIPFFFCWEIEVSILKKNKNKKNSQPYLKFLRPLP